MAGYVFKIMLEHTHSPVWRRVLVPERSTFHDLHRVIQAVFGWENDHLHAFSIPSRRIQIGSWEEDWTGYDYDYDEDRTLLEQLIFGQKSLRYTYDFGDDWIHKIIFEKVDEAYQGRTPVLLKAKGDNFEEDTGGVWGGDDPGNRHPFEEEKVSARLREMHFSGHEDLAAEKDNLESWKTQISGGAEPSAMAGKINAWKSSAAEEGGRKIEYRRGSRTNEQLLNDLGMQELKDYCKYLQIPTVPSWGREKLVGELASMMRSHPEYMMYVFFEDEWKELNRLRKMADGELRAERRYQGVYVKAMALGVMDVKFPEGEEWNRAVLELASDADALFPVMTTGESRRRYRHIRKMSDMLGNMILTYGMIEIHAMYTLFDRIYKEGLDETEFCRFLYWHARFNGLLQTVYSPDGSCFAVLDGLDPAQILQDTEQYAEDLEYKEYTQKELEERSFDMLSCYPELQMLFSCLTFSTQLPEETVGEVLTAVCCDVMSGLTLPEIFEHMSALKPGEQSLKTVCSLWEAVSGAMLVLPMPMLKGRSREEYAALKGLSPWSIRMTGQSAGGNAADKPMYEFPAEIQERMSGAMCLQTRDMNKLESYRKREHIRSEEFLYLLAEAHVGAGEFDKARRLADELARGSKRGREAAGLLEELISGGEEMWDDAKELEAAFSWDSIWDADAPGERRQPYVRVQPKIGRNDPCPCGSGKKYKHCCGR